MNISHVANEFFSVQPGTYALLLKIVSYVKLLGLCNSLLNL